MQDGQWGANPALMKTDEILDELGMDGPYPKSLYVSTMTERFGKRGYALPTPPL
jgi:hypothetical protein